MKYNTLNNIVGWAIFIIATMVYILTLEPTASYWDCGEFISSSYKLMIPHPPGAPFFLLIGRAFSFFAGDVTQVAYWVNMVSALSSSFTSLFLFWSITLLAKKIIRYDGQPTLGQTILILGSGVVGSLAYTFTDSAWFSAVEAEVYAMSSFFTAFVFWAILKWEAKAEESDSDKWIILIAYMMGLSIGVHLLNLLAIPALGLVVYLKKFKPDTKGIVITLVVSGVAMMSILVGIIPGLPSLAGWFEIMFVNNFKLPFGSGIIFFIVLLLAGLGIGIYYSILHQKRILNTALLCFTFILIGYASYAIIVVRTLYDPPIDMNDPGDVMRFVSYLKREQYGDRPLLKGPLFTAYQHDIKYEKGAPVYRKGNKKYEIYQYKTEYVFDSKHIGLLPRMYSPQAQHVRLYRQIVNLPKGKPTFWQNMKFMFKYQIGTMYLRYFMWNFAAREHDFYGAETMLPFQSDEGLPYLIKENKARNNYYWIPLILGILGMVYHFTRHRNDAWIVMVLFFFTGIAIVLYLNQPPVEPRERDYTFAASFWAFSIWIGLAVLFIADMLQKAVKSDAARGVLATLICLAAPAILAAQGWDDHDRSQRFHSVDSAKNILESCAPNAILFTGGDNDTYPLWYAQEVEGYRRDVRVCNLSLLNTDWYITQMKNRAYESAPLPISMPKEQYFEGTNDQVPIMENDKPLNLQEYIKLAAANDNAVKINTRGGEYVTYLPSKTLRLTINKDSLVKNKIVSEKYVPFLMDELVWSIDGNYIDKKSLIILDMLATNNWKRPIYFSTTVAPSDFMNLDPYMQLEGMAYRILPVRAPGAGPGGWVNTDSMYTKMMTKFHWRNLDNPKVYYNDWYYNFTSAEREQFSVLAENLLGEGKKDKAKQVLLHSLKVMPDTSLPFDRPVASYATLLFKVGEPQKAMEIVNTMGPRLEDALVYAVETGDFRELQNNLIIAQEFSIALRDNGKEKEAQVYHKLFDDYIDDFQRMRANL